MRKLLAVVLAFSAATAATIASADSPKMDCAQCKAHCGSVSAKPMANAKAKPTPTTQADPYQQAQLAFQKRDLDRALELAKQAAVSGGAHAFDAKLLYGDVLFMRGELARAKAVYITLHRQVTGTQSAVIARKLAAVNRMLKLAETHGL